MDPEKEGWLKDSTIDGLHRYTETKLQRSVGLLRGATRWDVGHNTTLDPATTSSVHRTVSTGAVRVVATLLATSITHTATCSDPPVAQSFQRNQHSVFGTPRLAELVEIWRLIERHPVQHKTPKRVALERTHHLPVHNHPGSAIHGMNIEATRAPMTPKAPVSSSVSYVSRYTDAFCRYLQRSHTPCAI